MKIKTKRFDKSIPLPRYEKLAAGFDFICRKGVRIKPKEIKAAPSNIAIEIPEGYVLLVVSRSSTPFRLGLLMLHSIGVSDPFYSGDQNEIMLVFYNFTEKVSIIKRGDRIAQGILVKYEKIDFEEVDKLNKARVKGRWKKPKRRLSK